MQWEEFLDYSPPEMELLREAYVDSLDVEDTRLSLLMALIANANAGKRKNGKPYAAEEFKVQRRPKKGGAQSAAPAQTMEQQKAILAAMTVLHGGKIKNKKFAGMTREQAEAVLKG